MNRKVKLTYQPGDADFNGTLTANDGTRVLTSAGTPEIFLPGEGQEERAVAFAELGLKVADYNIDGSRTGADGSSILAHAGTEADLRW